MRRPTESPTSVGAHGIVDNLPNAGRLFSSLRDSGYSNEVAVDDFVDNSIDAGASVVRVFVEPASGRLTPDTARVIVADDGGGMTGIELREALKLGTLADHDSASDLGKYGMGLITAAISMGQRLVVLTRTVDGELLRGVHDLQIIVARNAFVAEITSARASDLREWERYACSPEHGTIVFVENCDKLGYVNAGAFVTKLKRNLGQTFRRFIAAKTKVSEQGLFEVPFLAVNGDAVYAVDPLLLAENKPLFFPNTLALLGARFSELVADFEIPVPIDQSDSKGETDAVRVRVVNLPDLGRTVSEELGINAPSEGFYVMRNQREIAAAETLGVFAKAQGLTSFRAEIHVPATLDHRIGINWTKRRVEPDEQLRNLIKTNVGPHVASVRKHYDRKVAEDTAVNHKVYETLISRKAKLLTLPKVQKVVRGTGSTSGGVEPKNSGIRRTGTGDLSERFRDRCIFREAHMTSSGPLWEPEMAGSKIIVTFNVDHPLWVRFVLEQPDGDERSQNSVTELLHLFAFCLATAEFNVFGEEADFERLVNMRQQLSNNMRVLLT